LSVAILACLFTGLQEETQVAMLGISVAQFPERMSIATCKEGAIAFLFLFVMIAFHPTLT
jgi:hypothetical protein